MASIWVDLDNAPHVPFFAPIIRYMTAAGHQVHITMRDYGYTRELLDRHGLQADVIGRHPGRNLVRKVFGLAGRVASLAAWARGRRIDVSVSHGSRALCVASRAVGIPSVTLYDYEYVSTFIFNRLSRRVLLPQLMPDERVRAIGLDERKVVKYPGLKEEVYLGGFSPDDDIRSELSPAEDAAVVVLRPPATAAHYHNPESEAILDAVLQRIAADPRAFGVVVPRTHAEAERFARRWSGSDNVRVLTRAVDGLNLIWHADLVVGGGGTMNREAALLGVPVYSVFMGRAGAIDTALAEQGRIHFIRTLADAAAVEITRRDRPAVDGARERWRQRSDVLVRFISDQIESVGRSARGTK